MSTTLEDLLTAAMQTGMHMGAGRHPVLNAQNAEQQRVFQAAANRAWKAYRQQGGAVKAGARHSASDQRAIQDAHDRLVSAGAICGTATKAYALPQAIKSVGGGRVEGLLCRYSNPMSHDVQRDYFNNTTDFGISDGAILPVLWHHNLDPDKKGVIGKGQVTFTPEGLWFVSWLNQRDKYEQLILKMVEMAKAGYSGGASAIARLASAGQSRLITKFHLVEGSITPIPADPGNLVSLKALASTEDPRATRIKKELRQLEERQKRDLLLELEAIEDEHTRTQRILAELREIEGR